MGEVSRPVSSWLLINVECKGLIQTCIWFAVEILMLVILVFSSSLKRSWDAVVLEDMVMNSLGLVLFGEFLRSLFISDKRVF